MKRKLQGVVLLMFLATTIFIAGCEKGTKDTSEATTKGAATSEATTTEQVVVEPFDPVPFYTANTEEFLNPINVGGPDPHAMYNDKDGYFYFTRTLGNRLDIWRSRSLSGINLGERKTVFYVPPGNCDIWAPEIHLINDKWYIYYTMRIDCADNSNPDKNRGVYVLENSSPNPLDGTWVDKGRVNTVGPGLDGTVMEHEGDLYFFYGLYGNWSGAHGSGISVAKMSDPWTLVGEETLLTYPEQAWEKKGMHVNEGAVLMKRDDKIHLIFSGSACWMDEYALGLLTTTVDKDILDKESWVKHDGPVFKSSSENGVYGPGHNFVVKSKDGLEDWNIYHGNNRPMGGSGCGVRPTRLQPITWDEQAMPNFGIPTRGPIPVPSSDYTIHFKHGVTTEATIKQVASTDVVVLDNNKSKVEINDVMVPEAGLYTITVKYTNTSDASVNVAVNKEATKNIALPGGSDHASFDVYLNKGYHNTITFSQEHGKAELESIELSGEVTFSIEDDAQYKIINNFGGKAIHLGALNNIVMMNDSNGGQNQRFRFVLLADHTFKIVHTQTNRVLSLENPTATNVRLLPWTDKDSQKWRVVHVGNGFFKFINLENNRALDVDGASNEAGANVGTWDDIEGNTAQLFIIHKLAQ